jgi:cytochrome c-type biogenesis protein CcmF
LDQTFLNEHLLPGKIGQLFVVLSFVAALLSASAYFRASYATIDVDKKNWLKLGQFSFHLHSVSVFGIFSILFYLIFNHYYEYHYVWQHSSNTLPFKYLLSCFWEGQEGSFLLWTIWHCVLSYFIIGKDKKWEAPVMAIVALVQVFLAATLLGIHLGDIKIGSTPFMLLRDQMANAPIFSQPNYLSFIQDGNGLNPLLQNYWMVIHPPILFLGFAASLFPFAYAVASLWRVDFEDLVKPLLRWSLFTGMILGTGIMMGGAWAYESLNFGGYWAWDPVENASLVPWIIMVAGLHTVMIYKSTGYSLKTTLLFFILSFILVLYSTFLTRTGILGETSVHAFTGEGDFLFYHLLIFMGTLLGLALFLFFKNYKKVPDHKKEEEALTSREFWMFIGSLVLMISVVQITYTTSMPVWNKLFGTNLAITDPVTHYNKIQIWITSLILLGTSCIYYLKFKHTNMVDMLKKISIPVIISAILTIVICYTQKLSNGPIVVFMSLSVLSAVANLYYLATVIKTNIIKWGGTTAHLGFGLMMVGVILSGYNKEVISINRMGVDFDMGKKTAEENKKESQENLLLFRNVPVTMSGYNITYIGDTVAEPNHYYKVKYQKYASTSEKLEEEFILTPNAQINPKMGLISSPDTRHYLTHDIFTYVTSTVDKSKVKDTVSYKSKKVKLGDSLFFTSGFMIFNGFDTKNFTSSYKPETGDIAVAAKLSVFNLEGQEKLSAPTYVVRNQSEVIVEDTVKDYSLYTRLAKIIPEENAAIIEFKQPNAMDDYIIMKAILFPYINVLWIGTILMILGFFISLYKRIKTK